MSEFSNGAPFMVFGAPKGGNVDASGNLKSLSLAIRGQDLEPGALYQLEATVLSDGRRYLDHYRHPACQLFAEEDELLSAYPLLDYLFRPGWNSLDELSIRIVTEIFTAYGRPPGPGGPLASSKVVIRPNSSDDVKMRRSLMKGAKDSLVWAYTKGYLEVLVPEHRFASGLLSRFGLPATSLGNDQGYALRT